ncbi:hypothetical protein V8E36_003356 [Tilletia maclaganii]
MSSPQIYFRKRPALLGTNGKKIMQTNSTSMQKRVGSALRRKFTGMRSNLKDRASFPHVLGYRGQADSRNAYDTAAEWFKSYSIDVTLYRVYRLVVLRATAKENMVQVNGQWSLPPNFWTTVSTRTTRIMNESMKGPDEKLAICKAMDALVEADKQEYGDFEVLQDESMVKAEREIDLCVLEAGGPRPSSHVEVRRRTPTATASAIAQQERRNQVVKAPQHLKDPLRPPRTANVMDSSDDDAQTSARRTRFDFGPTAMDEEDEVENSPLGATRFKDALDEDDDDEDEYENAPGLRNLSDELIEDGRLSDRSEEY